MPPTPGFPEGDLYQMPLEVLADLPSRVAAQIIELYVMTDRFAWEQRAEQTRHTLDFSEH